MKITYIVTTRMPTEKAHGYQISKVCEKLAEQGAIVQLLCPRFAGKTSDIFDFYSISRNFEVRAVPYMFHAFVMKCISSSSYHLRSFFFFLRLIMTAIPLDTIVLTRSPEVAFLFRLKGNTVVIYAHNWPNRHQWLYRRLIGRVNGVIANSRGTAEQFIAHRIGPVEIVHNGVDLREFTFSEVKMVLRKELGLPEKNNIVLYAGHLYAWKGVDVMVEAAEKTTDKSMLFVLVGGTPQDIEKYKAKVREKNLSNVLVVGYVPQNRVPRYLKAADVLLLPNVAITEESIRYTSPIKMFEYMASGVPIIASDLPSIREVLTDSNAFFVPAGDSHALADKVHALCMQEFHKKARAVASQAASDVQKFTWDMQVKLIYNFLKTIDSKISYE